MPEQISKYPDVTLKVLKGAGARCGEGITPKILTKCPAERFCSLSTGEICVYGIKEIPQMTQIATKELAQVVCPGARPSSMAVPAPWSAEVIAVAGALVVGLAVGRYRSRAKTRRGAETPSPSHEMD
jgi:hypothetical protein